MPPERPILPRACCVTLLKTPKDKTQKNIKSDIPSMYPASQEIYLGRQSKSPSMGATQPRLNPGSNH